MHKLVFLRRGIMLDPARGMDKKEHYFFLLPWLREWGYNLLHFHITDDQGCALRFPRRPELAGRGAFEPEEMRRFVREARRNRIEVMPEIECFGHTGFITNTPRYRVLGRTKQGVAGVCAIDPDHPETRRVLADLIADAAEIFDCDIIHAGLDEVNLSVLPAYQSLPKDEHWTVFARHAAWVHQAIRKVGRRPAMWGDHMLSEKRLAGKFARDVLIFDWHYYPEFTPASLDYFLGEKFETWGCPSTMCFNNSVLVNSGILANVRQFSAHALLRRKKGLTGMVNTIWCPWRYLPGAMDWPMALAGHLFAVEEEDPGYCAVFCADYYGLQRSDAKAAAVAMAQLYNAVPLYGRWCDYFLRVGRTKTTAEVLAREFTREHKRLAEILAQEAGKCAVTLARVIRKARRNQKRLHDVLLSARILERVGLFAAAGRTTQGLPKDASLLNACARNWNRVRVEQWQPGKAIPSPSRDNVLQVAQAVA